MSERQRPKRRPSCQITERDYKILRHLWKWKAHSTMAMARKFFAEIRASSAYRRLQYLETDGYIMSTVVEGRRREVWSLAKKGFGYILPKLGALEHVGYKSENLYHDYLASAFHLGEWLTHQPSDTQTYSEQQLRRYPVDVWPDWVPRSVSHRPDGYSVYNQGGENVVIAFEAELSLKSQHRYESVVASYDSQDAIRFVFWLVDTKRTLKSMKQAFDKFGVRNWSKHHFILLSDFRDKGWMAPFTEGQFKGRNLSDFMNRTGVEMASKWHRGCDVSALLETRRRPINQATSKQNAISKITD